MFTITLGETSRQALIEAAKANVPLKEGHGLGTPRVYTNSDAAGEGSFLVVDFPITRGNTVVSRAAVRLQPVVWQALEVGTGGA